MMKVMSMKTMNAAAKPKMRVKKTQGKSMKAGKPKMRVMKTQGSVKAAKTGTPMKAMKKKKKGVENQQELHEELMQKITKPLEKMNDEEKMALMKDCDINNSDCEYHGTKRSYVLIVNVGDVWL